jgi:signal transduction histidine kinase
MKLLRRIFSVVMRRVVRIYRSLYFPPTVICIAILVATLFGWQAAKQSLAHDLRGAEEVRVAQAGQAIQSRISTYEQILRGGVGLFQGSDRVTLDDWSNYLTAFDIAHNYPGVQAIGFAQVMTPDEVPDVANFLASEGVENFQVTPANPSASQYAAVTYLKSISNMPAAYGFDMYSQPTRRAAMLRARDEDQTTVTPRIQLMSTDGSHPTGFNMYEPYYGASVPTTVAERQQNIKGYVYASFRTNNFFKGIESQLDGRLIGFSITVNKDTQPLYTSPTYNTIGARHHTGYVARSVAMYGQTWHIRFAIDDKLIVSNVQLKRPQGILIFGIFMALLVSIIILLVLRGRARDLAAQNERAVELAKDELLSLASHQLRTPATGVKQYVGMVLQGFVGDVSEEQQALLEKAYASNDRQLRIINEILHLAKIDSGRIVLAKTTTNLNDLVSDVANEQQSDLNAARHKFKLTLPKKAIMVNVDNHTLRMAIENLLSNAIKYTRPGGNISITVRRSHMKALIEVQDSGVGISNSDLNKIFRQFSRLPNEMSQMVEGTGIGLYLAKHLVELHKGTIRVVSQQGKGSTFTIELPIKVDPMRNLTVSRKR